jgi:hypothetical protein
MDGTTDDPQVFRADDVIFVPLSSPDLPPPSSPEVANDNRQFTSCRPDAYAALPVELRFAALCLSPPWPDPADTQRLDPKHVRDDASEGHAPALNDAAELHALRRLLWDYVDAKQAEGRKVKQSEALDEVLHMAHEDLHYHGLKRWRAQTEIVQVVWELRSKLP